MFGSKEKRNSLGARMISSNNFSEEKDTPRMRD